MGFEPLFCLLLPVIGFLLQAFLAIRAAVLDRWRRGLVRFESLLRQAGELGWTYDRPGHWRGSCEGRSFELDLRLLRTDRQRRTLEKLVGERMPAGRWTPLGVHSVLLTVPLATGVPGLRLAARSSGLSHTPVGDLIGDLALCASADDPTAAARWLAAGRREVVLDFLGTHPRTVILEDRILWWLHDEHADLDVLLRQVLEVVHRLEAPVAHGARAETAPHRRIFQEAWSASTSS